MSDEELDVLISKNNSIINDLNLFTLFNEPTPLTTPVNDVESINQIIQEPG